ncbi:TIGR01777 family oxidoreductase [Bacillus sp. CGMCC 1.16541]|uniref:TIGR01777 family oxidoreductase n=1 Tax=Bacillus sp. CGMCC 1.16541 TaxID=2185143 RepID=UPI000D73D004|nr:TIGR01777 family oxidoreductase [Bacillus sp. CGMCC 1.16541]
MKIVIAGGTGFVGSALTNYFLANKHDVYILTRNTNKPAHDPKLHYVEWLTNGSAPEHELEGADVFINLAGVSLNSGRWTDERKKAIIESRVSSTKEIVRIMSVLHTKPAVYVNASAVGYYGTSTTETFVEHSPSISDENDFLAHTVKVWEKEAAQAEQLNIRTVLTRFGIILGEKEGALPKMLLPYQLFVGGTVGTGEQWVSWVHIDDVVRSIAFVIEHEHVRGPVNITAPHPVRMKEFGQTIARVLSRPHWLPVPSFGLKLLLGEMSTLILDGQHVIPQKLGEHHYKFTYNKLERALQDLL